MWKKRCLISTFWISWKWIESDGTLPDWTALLLGGCLMVPPVHPKQRRVFCQHSLVHPGSTDPQALHILYSLWDKRPCTIHLALVTMARKLDKFSASVGKTVVVADLDAW
jgi:hypothetical protein